MVSRDPCLLWQCPKKSNRVPLKQIFSLNHPISLPLLGVMQHQNNSSQVHIPSVLSNLTTISAHLTPERKRTEMSAELWFWGKLSLVRWSRMFTSVSRSCPLNTHIAIVSFTSSAFRVSLLILNLTRFISTRGFSPRHCSYLLMNSVVSIQVAESKADIVPMLLNVLGWTSHVPVHTDVV